MKQMDQVEGGILKMAEGFKHFGCHVEADNSFVIRQWAPGAQVNLFKNSRSIYAMFHKV